MIREAIRKTVERQNLTASEAEMVMREIMSGEASECQIAALLTALRMKGETVQEISAFARMMCDFSKRIHPKVKGRIVDTCGTGGDQVKSFNVSTISAFVIAGAGLPVAKHANSSATGECGSADVLERLGLTLQANPEEVQRAIEDIGIGVLFAPAFHPAMKYAVKPRKELGVRTVFNILGPLTNPAGAGAQLIGVHDPVLTKTIAEVSGRLGRSEVMVVHGLDGMDEISISNRTAVAWLRNGKVSQLELTPEDFGVPRGSVEEVLGSTPDENARVFLRILDGDVEDGDAKRNMVLVNSAAGIVVGGLTDNWREAVEIARQSIDSGAAYKKLRSLIRRMGDVSRIDEYESR